jgi:hypothetical protein
MRNNFRQWFKYLALLAVLTGTGSAQAGYVVGARITRIDHYAAGNVLVTFNMTKTSNPSCASASPSSLVFSAATDAGRALLSTVTAAMLAGKTVNLTGLNTCLVLTNFETLSQIAVID